MRLLAAPFVLATLISGAHAQSVDAATRAVVVDRAITQIRDHYVDASAGAKVEAALGSDPDAFDDSTGAQAFADNLTKRLHSVVADRHLHVEYSPEPLSVEPVPDAGEEARRHARDERSNYGVERVERRLPGNIGYIDLRSFAKTDWAADTLAAAMTLVAHPDALIIDLRHNGGGYPATAVLLESYLFNARTHVVDIYWREGDRTEQFWTQDSVAGSRFGQEKPIWILTSIHTFSGAEEFAYDLKNLKRATVVGETT
ncbi:MAG: S41 family peptidase, partial [Caldimonas sp.]